jgi:hypothetical protein
MIAQQQQGTTVKSLLKLPELSLFEKTNQNQYQKGKGKAVPVHTMKVHRWRRGTAPLIHNLCTRSNNMMMIVWLQHKVPSPNKSALNVTVQNFKSNFMNHIL